MNCAWIMLSICADWQYLTYCTSSRPKGPPDLQFPGVRADTLSLYLPVSNVFFLSFHHTTREGAQEEGLLIILLRLFRVIDSMYTLHSLRTSVEHCCGYFDLCSSCKTLLKSSSSSASVQTASSLTKWICKISKHLLKRYQYLHINMAN